jgi:hypothetical protein
MQLMLNVVPLNLTVVTTHYSVIKGKSTPNRLESSEGWGGGGRGIALQTLDLGARSGWEVSTTPRPLYPRERPGTGGWVAPGPVWTCTKILASTGIRSPDRPARSQSLYRLSYPGPYKCDCKLLIT